MPLGRCPVGSEIEWNDQALIAAPGITEAEQLQMIEHRPDRRAGCRLQDDREQTRRAEEIPLPDGVSRVVGERRVQTPGVLGRARQPTGEREPLTLCLAQTKLHCAQTAQPEKYIFRAGADGEGVEGLA